MIAEQITGAHWPGPRFFGVTGLLRRHITAGTLPALDARNCRAPELAV
jgi:hypothetical protein